MHVSLAVMVYEPFNRNASVLREMNAGVSVTVMPLCRGGKYTREYF